MYLATMQVIYLISRCHKEYIRATLKGRKNLTKLLFVVGVGVAVPFRILFKVRRLRIFSDCAHYTSYQPLENIYVISSHRCPSYFHFRPSFWRKYTAILMSYHITQEGVRWSNGSSVLRLNSQKFVPKGPILIYHAVRSRDREVLGGVRVSKSSRKEGQIFQIISETRDEGGLKEGESEDEGRTKRINLM